MVRSWLRQNQHSNAEACRCGNQHLIELRQVIKTYETAAGPVTVLKNINLQIDKMVTHDADLARRVTRTVILSDGEIIDEYLARIFPALTEEQLIWATHHLERQTYAPGSVIIQEGGTPDKFYLITKGYVEVVLQSATGQKLIVSRINAGQYFGEIELIHGGRHIATIQAAPTSEVEVVTLDRETFDRLMAESRSTWAELDRVAHERMAENAAGRNVIEGSSVTAKKVADHG